MNNELPVQKLLDEADELWHDRSGHIGFGAERATCAIGQTVINGRLYEMQLIMTAKIEEIQLPTELLP